MVFSSLPAYLDPSNWQQNPQIIGSTSNSSSPNPRLPAPAVTPPPAPPPAQPHGGSIRPGSMSERARLANIPMPEVALKCPRCESTNTKFCYFNNYSLTQPRHFCKTCRRYWTRGGALRNVPVGGGCRRNKRSKSSSRSKSPASVDRHTSSTSTAPISSTPTSNILGLSPQFPPLRFTSQLTQLSDNFAGDLGLNYGGISAPAVGFNEAGFQLGASSNFLEPWRLQQFPILSGLDPSGLGIYQFHQGGELGLLDGSGEAMTRPKLSSTLLSQLASVKMEENGPEANLSRQMQLGGMAPLATDHHHHQWNANLNGGWTELSGFSSSSTTSNPLQQ